MFQVCINVVGDGGVSVWDVFSVRQIQVLFGYLYFFGCESLVVFRGLCFFNRCFIDIFQQDLVRLQGWLNKYEFFVGQDNDSVYYVLYIGVRIVYVI